jgi:hypothetical protein
LLIGGPVTGAAMKTSVRTTKPVVNTNRRTPPNTTADFDHLTAVVRAAVDRYQHLQR